MRLPVRYKLILLWIAVLVFYVLTLAPTVLWGDHAFFQRAAFEGIVSREGGGHWLWLQLARLFVDLPVGTVAFRVNLLSAVAGTVTLIFLSNAIRSIGLSWVSAVIACVSLAISHTFWMHSVRAEVYSVFTALIALQLWLWLSWRPKRPWPLHLAAGLFGVTLLGHQMAVLLLPAAMVLLWRQRSWLSRRDWLILSGLFLLGMLPFLAVAYGQVEGDGLLHSLRLYFTHADVDYGPAMFDFSPGRVPRDAAMWLGLLGLQFVGPAGLLGLYGIGGNTWKSSTWLAILVFYATSVFFAFSYHVNDQFVFYLPSYVAFSFFIAKGYQRTTAASRQRPHLIGTTVLLLTVILPVSVYAALPRVLTAYEFNPLGIRELPGREPNRYFLWPASNNDYGAELYARTALEGLPPDSVMIAEHTPLEPLRYFQSIEGLRQDVQLIKIERNDDLEPVLSGIPSGKAVFIADNNPDYYNLTSLPDVCAQPFGNVFELQVGASAESCP